MTDDQIAELRGLLEAATSCRAHGQSLIDWHDNRQRARFEIVDRLPGVLDRVDALTEALRPFAEALREWGDEPDNSNDRSLWDHPLAMCISIGDFRLARSTLADGEGK